MEGIDSEVLKFAIWGIVSIVFDNTFVLLRSVKTISVVIFRAMIFGILEADSRYYDKNRNSMAYNRNH